MQKIMQLFEALPAWLRPREFEDEETSRLSLLTYIVALVHGVNALARAVIALITHPELPVASIAGPLLFVLFYLVVLVLLQLGYLRLAGMIILFIQGGLILLVSLKFGGIQSGSFFIFPVFIISGSMLFGSRGALFTGFYTFCTGFLLISLEKHGLLPPAPISPTSAILFWYNLMPTIITISLYMALQHYSLFSAFLRARKGEYFIKHLAEMMPGILYIFNLPLQKNTYLNRSLFSLLGYRAENSRQNTDEDIQPLIHADDLAQRQAQHLSLANYTDNQILESEFRVKQQLGEYRWLHCWEQIFSRDAACQPLEIIGVAQDVTEQRATSELLRQKKEELERFIFTISHDLKTPLITINAFTDSLEQDIARQNPERIARDLKRVRSSTVRMQMLLHELLDFMRIGYQPNSATTFSLQELIEETRELIAGRLANRQLNMEVTKQPIMLHGDRPRLVQAMQNLLDNAVKFSSEYQPLHIKIDVRERNNQLELLIQDNGIGIAPEHQNKIFRLFEKIDPHTEGTGIGLVMVKRIIEEQGGKIWFESAGQEQGTTFFLTLPGMYRAPSTALS